MRDYQFFFSEEMRNATAADGPLMSRKHKIMIKPGKGAEELRKVMEK
jgi:hypothetical protein